jgi:hypothetical protein
MRISEEAARRLFVCYVLRREVCEGDSVTCLDAAGIEDVSRLARINVTKDKFFLDKMSLQTTVHTFVPTEGPV